MDRKDAQKIVDEVTIKVNQFKAVSLEDCLRLLETQKFLLLRQDPIRRAGPSKETVYPWNVVDYLQKD